MECNPIEDFSHKDDAVSKKSILDDNTLQNAAFQSMPLDFTIGDFSDADNAQFILEDTICSLAKERIKCTEEIMCLHQLSLHQSEPVEISYQTTGKTTTAITFPDVESMEPLRHFFVDLHRISTDLLEDVPKLVNQCERHCRAVDQNRNMLNSNTDQILFSVKKKGRKGKLRNFQKRRTQSGLSRSLNLTDDVSTPRRSVRLRLSGTSSKDRTTKRRTRSGSKSSLGKVS